MELDPEYLVQSSARLLLVECLLQTAVRASLHVSLCRRLCSLSIVGVSVLEVCALGLNPLRPRSLNIPKNT